MTTGKLNCVSAKSDKPHEIQWEFPLRWVNMPRRHDSVVVLGPKLDFEPDINVENGDVNKAWDRRGGDGVSRKSSE